MKIHASQGQVCFWKGGIWFLFEWTSGENIFPEQGRVKSMSPSQLHSHTRMRSYMQVYVGHAEVRSEAAAFPIHCQWDWRTMWPIDAASQQFLDLSGAWSWARLNFLVATVVHVVLRQAITCLSNRTPTEHRELHKSISNNGSRHVDDIRPPPLCRLPRPPTRRCTTAPQPLPAFDTPADLMRLWPL